MINNLAFLVNNVKKPAGATINSNGVITWTPSEAQGPSTNTLTSVVSDGSLSATNSFVVIVTEVNAAPSFLATPPAVSTTTSASNGAAS